MQKKKIDPREQFSKKLAGRTEWFWFFYMLVIVVAIVISPDSSQASIVLAILTTIVMVTSVLAYTHNSVYEKALYSIQTMEKMKLLSGKGDKSEESDDNSDEDSEETNEESNEESEG